MESTDSPIYVVIHDPQERDRIARFCLSQGFTPKPLPSAEAFLDVYHAGRPAVLIVDMPLPTMHGSKLIEKLAAAGDLPPTIAMAERPDLPTVVRVIKAGALDFFDRRVDAALLRDRIGQALELAHAPPPQPAATPPVTAAEPARPPAEPAAPRGKPLGEYLIENKVLSAEQVEAILAHQAYHNAPFGELATKLFAVHPTEVWRARAEQLLPLLPVVDVAREKSEPDALAMISQSEAATYWLLPIRMQGDRLRVATTRDRFANAMVYCHSALRRLTIQWVIGEPTRIRDRIKACYGRAPMTTLDSGDTFESPTVRIKSGGLINPPITIVSPSGTRTTGGVAPMAATATAMREKPNNADPAATPAAAPRAGTARLTIRCAHCDEPIEVQESHLGRRIGCPHCGEPTAISETVSLNLGTYEDQMPARQQQSTAADFGGMGSDDITLKFKCEHCEHRIKVWGSWANKRVRCPACSATTTVPSSMTNPRVIRVETLLGKTAYTNPAMQQET